MFFLSRTTDKVRATGNTYMWVSVKWKTKDQTDGSNRLTYTGLRGTGTPNNRDEVNRIEV